MRLAPEDSSPQPRASARISALFLLVSFLASLAFLFSRNMYDDEIGTIGLLPLSTARIVHTMNHADVHPPGMYVLAHLGYVALHSPRWITLFPLACLYTGLAFFVFAVAPLFRSATARICFLLMATLHPQLLMWSNSIRWYPWWTGLALLTVTIALNPSSGSAYTLTKPRAAVLGLSIAALFYLNYITIIFTFALAAGLFLRYGRRVWKQLLIAFAVALVLIAPQLRPFFTVHLHGSEGQRSNPLVSAARLVQSLFSSEAFLPWHPAAVASVLLMTLLTLVGAWKGFHYLRAKRLTSAAEEDKVLASLLLTALLFLVLIAVAGLGGKPRNGLALVPLLAPGIALVVGGLRPRAAQLCLAFFFVWSAWGIVHLIRREGLTKSGMNNRPEEVLQFIERSRGDACSVVITYDPILTYYLVESHLPRQRVLTLSQNNIYRDAAPFAPAECAATELYVVQSYLGGFGGYESILPEQLRLATAFIRTPLRVNRFSRDPDAPIKRRLKFIGGSADLPDFRYLVGSGSIATDDLPKLEAALPYLTVADGHTAPRQP